jgi:uncharacterized membrane protein
LATAQVSYTVTDLGSISPTAINSWAQVVGNYNGRAYLYTLGRVQPLSVPNGSTFSDAVAINDLGMVAGTTDGPGTAASPYTGVPDTACGSLTQPVIWKNGRVQKLGTVGFQAEFASYWCGFSEYGSGMNASGQVIGFTPELFDLYAWAVLWTPKASSKLPVTPVVSANQLNLFGSSWVPTLALSINNTGEIVGENGVPGGIVAHATLWKNGTTTDLGGLYSGDPISVASAASSVNDVGQMVGWASTAPPDFFECYGPSSTDCPIHAVLWNANGAITDLGTLPGDSVSAAVKINLFGLVIGGSGNSVARSLSGSGPLQVPGRPFIWSKHTGMRDLNTLIAANSGWVLQSVTDMNAWGQIVGTGIHNGKTRGFLLTPTKIAPF